MSPLLRKLQELTTPLIVSHLWQVTLEDFRIWKKEVGELENVKMISYPGLNHLFIEGKGISLLSEYSQPGNVPKYVIEDISEWIGKTCQ